MYICVYLGSLGDLHLASSVSFNCVRSVAMIFHARARKFIRILIQMSERLPALKRMPARRVYVYDTSIVHHNLTFMRHSRP